MLDNLHEVLREALRSRGWSVARFSGEVGVSPQLAYKWLAEDERWRVIPSPASCNKIAAALALDPDYVLRLAGHREAPLTTDTDDADPAFEAFVRLITPGWRAMTPSEREVAKRGALALFSVSPTRARGTEGAGAIGGRGNGRQYDSGRAKGTKNGRDDGLARWYRNGENVLARIARFVEPRTAAPAL